MRKPFGLQLLLDLAGCNPEKLTEEKYIRQWASELIELIRMHAHGEPICSLFGEGDVYGWSFIQPIKTSHFALHCQPNGDQAIIDVFSCRWFDANAATQFCIKFFDAGQASATVRRRGIVDDNVEPDKLPGEPS